MNGFSAGSCIRFGWETFWKRPWFLIGVPFLATVIYGLVSSAASEAEKAGIAIAIIVGIINFFTAILYQMGGVNFGLKTVDDVLSVKAADYWHTSDLWRFFGASILVAICYVVAFLCAVIGGGVVGGIVYLAAGSSSGGVAFFIALVVLSIAFVGFVGVTLLFARYIVISGSIGPVKALKYSAHITRGYRWQLAWLIILCLLVNVVGLVCLIVGLFVTVPVTSIATLRAYRILSQKTISVA